MFEVQYTESDLPAIDFQVTNAALALFLLRLIARLRSIATLPAIDILAYVKGGIQTAQR